MSRIRIIIPTQLSEEEYRKTNYYKSIEKVSHLSTDHQCFIRIVEKNTRGLSELYNEYLHKFTEYHLSGFNGCTGPVQDILVFIHDDLEIHDAFFVEKLLKAHEKYDIVGLAGATSQDYSGNTPAWHLSVKGPRDGRGIVSHYIPAQANLNGFTNTNPGFYNSVFFGPTPAEVVMIDGLFMSFDLQKIANCPRNDLLSEEENELFDNEFSFHFYDMAMCCRAKRMYRNFKIGVWPIFTIHHGLGDFNADPLWHTLAMRFKEKYGRHNVALQY